MPEQANNLQSTPAEPLDVSVVLPTFNEAENLRVLIPEICEALRAAGLRGEVIVVDDDSPDGTGDVALQLSRGFPVRVQVRRGERGLATAVLAGFGMAEARVCVVMDADGSHPVSALPEMIRPLLEDRADITVGSRNVPGGSSAGWPWHRRLISKSAALLTLGLTRLRDPTSGFMGIRRELIEGLSLDPVGWKIVLEIVVKARPHRLLEVPIAFRDRELGRSKMGIGVQWSYLRHLLRLYRFRYQGVFEFVQFCMVGFSGIFVDLGVVVGCKELMALDTRICAAAGFAVAVTTNYLLNRLWTFRARRDTPWLRSYAVFVGVCSLGLVVRLLIIHGLIELAGLDTGRWYLVTNAVGILAATAVNFLGSKYLAFSPSRLAFGRKPDRED